MGHVTSWTKLECRRCWKLTETMHTYKTHGAAGSLGLDLGQKAAVYHDNIDIFGGQAAATESHLQSHFVQINPASVSLVIFPT